MLNISPLVFLNHLHKDLLHLLIPAVCHTHQILYATACITSIFPLVFLNQLHKVCYTHQILITIMPLLASTQYFPLFSSINISLNGSQIAQPLLARHRAS